MINESAYLVSEFQGRSLARTLASLEGSLLGVGRAEVSDICSGLSLNDELVRAVLDVKALAAQIDVVLHAVGIVSALREILEVGEHIVSLSLGAGNTGRDFDVETNIRVCEFKFIRWQGGSEAIRQNSLFKDFYELAEAETDRRKELYVVGTELPLKFLYGKRSLSSVLSSSPKIREAFFDKYGDRFGTVSEYYQHKKNDVSILDVAALVAGLRNTSESDDHLSGSELITDNPGLADRIRAFVNKKYLVPYRKSGRLEFSVDAADIHNGLGLESRYPAVCSAIDAAKFERDFGVRISRREGPKQGATARWTIRLD